MRLRQRRREDARALALLQARPRWLDFTDSQYEESAPVETLAAALREALREAGAAGDTVLCPLGLFHSDHRLAHEAAAAATSGLGAHVLWYEDSPYRGMPGMLQERLAELAVAGVQATPTGEAAAGDGADAAARKALAIDAYASQLRAFGPGGLPDAALPERFWRLKAAEAAR